MTVLSIIAEGGSMGTATPGPSTAYYWQLFPHRLWQLGCTHNRTYPWTPMLPPIANNTSTGWLQELALWPLWLDTKPTLKTDTTKQILICQLTLADCLETFKYYRDSTFYFSSLFHMSSVLSDLYQRNIPISGVSFTDSVIIQLLDIMLDMTARLKIDADCPLVQD